MSINESSLYITETLKTWFNYPKERLYCQVSTSTKSQSHVRTMDLYHINTQGYPIFLTETSSRKWKDLKCNSNISICIFDLQYGQILAEGKAILKTALEDTALAQYYWLNHLDQYWRDFYIRRDKQFNCSGVPKSFGIITMIPNFWEIIKINSEDYLASSREQFYLKNGIWTSIQAKPI